MHAIARTLIVSSLALATGLASAGPRHYGHHGHHRGHHHHHHRGVGLAVGLAVALPLLALAAHHNADRTPDVVYVPPPAPPQPVYVTPAPQPVYVAPSRSAPVIYPRNGQSAVAQEADFRDCNRWATTQQAAMADSGVFQRAVEACMDGRGYTLR